MEHSTEEYHRKQPSLEPIDFVGCVCTHALRQKTRRQSQLEKKERQRRVTIMQANAAYLESLEIPFSTLFTEE